MLQGDHDFLQAANELVDGHAATSVLGSPGEGWQGHDWSKAAHNLLQYITNIKLATKWPPFYVKLGHLLSNLVKTVKLCPAEFADIFEAMLNTQFLRLSIRNGLSFDILDRISSPSQYSCLLSCLQERKDAWPYAQSAY